ncbi:hypothetical protein NHQ30_005850 [Ciborinia camelliae]|nr:hypothetical protein NHQ30_005850 [Ciborinia camelliae]
MDSKLPTYENNDGPAPPSYLDSLSSHSSASRIPEPSKSTSYGSQIQSQLNHISTQFTSLETQKSLAAHAQEHKILSLLSNRIQIYLSEFANTGLRKGTLILIPAQCLANEKAEPLDFQGEDKSGYDAFVQVGDKEGLNGGVWFWEDEDMAERLAGALKPFRELPSRPNPAVVSQRGSSSRFWRRKSSSKNEDVKASSAVSEPTDKVLMDVKAEEVVFEYENSFGLLETQRGYGVVLHLKIVTTK